MEVLTLVGGFRGLGALSTQTRIELVDALNAQTTEMYSTIARLRDLSGRGQLPAYSVSRLEDSFDQLEDRIIALQNRVNELEEADVAGWRADMQQAAAMVQLWVRDARSVMGDEIGGRGLRLTLLALGSVVVLGGLAWGVYRYNARRRRRRR